MRDFNCDRAIKPQGPVDLLETFSDEEIASLVEGLTSSQKSFVLEYCRKIYNGVGIVQGPFGTEKTAIIKLLQKLRQHTRVVVCLLSLLKHNA